MSRDDPACQPCLEMNRNLFRASTTVKDLAELNVYISRYTLLSYFFSTQQPPNRTYFYTESTLPLLAHFQPQTNIPINMPVRRANPTAAHTTRTTRSTARPSLKTKILGPKRTAPRRTAGATTTTTTTTTRTTRTTGGHHAGAGAGTGVVHHHKRHATVGDKVSGALMKLRGSLTSKPGLKVSR
jgi:hypothetical protein